MSKALVLGAAALALSAGAASAQVYPGYGYNGATVPLYDYAAPAYDYAATTPLYDYAAPAYAAPATAGTTVIIVMPAPAHTARSVYAAPQVYTAPPVTTGYYGAPAVSQPIYAYAPGYGYGYTPGYWNRGYWGRYGYGWR